MNAPKFIKKLLGDSRIDAGSVKKKKKTDDHGMRRNSWLMDMELSDPVLIKIHAEYSNCGTTGSTVDLFIDGVLAERWQVTFEQLKYVETALDGMLETGKRIRKVARKNRVAELFKEITG